MHYKVATMQRFTGVRALDRGFFSPRFHGNRFTARRRALLSRKKDRGAVCGRTSAAAIRCWQFRYKYNLFAPTKENNLSKATIVYANATNSSVERLTG